MNYKSLESRGIGKTGTEAPKGASFIIWEHITAPELGAVEHVILTRTLPSSFIQEHQSEREHKNHNSGNN